MTGSDLDDAPGPSQARIRAILDTPEARDRALLAFALVIRRDLSVDAALSILTWAPDLRRADAVAAFLAAVPTHAGADLRH